MQFICLSFPGIKHGCSDKFFSACFFYFLFGSHDPSAIRIWCFSGALCWLYTWINFFQIEENLNSRPHALTNAQNKPLMKWQTNFLILIWRSRHEDFFTLHSWIDSVNRNLSWFDSASGWICKCQYARISVKATFDRQSLFGNNNNDNKMTNANGECKKK